MKKGRVILILVVLIAAVGAVLALEPNSSRTIRSLFHDKSSYKGKDKAAWMADLGSDDNKVSGRAYSALSWPGDDGEDPVPVLVAIINEGNGRARTKAVQAIGAMAGNPEYKPAATNALPELKKCLKDSDPAVKAQAEDALKSFDRDQKKSEIPTLVSNLGDENEQVVRKAAEALAGFKGDASEAIAPLTKLYKEYTAKMEAATAKQKEALAKKDDAAAKKYEEQALNDESMAKAAGDSLWEIDQEAAKKAGYEKKAIDRQKVGISG